MRPQPRRRSRSRRTAALPLVLALLAAPLPGATAEDGPEPDRVELEYRRERAEATRQARPAAPALPAELHRETAKPDGPEVQAATRPGEPEAPASDGIAAAAERAARHEARHAVGEVGVPSYYRVGVWEGMRVALDDRTVGLRDHRQGLREGRHDPLAREIGFDAGAREATAAALAEAERQVARQFRDLSREPRFDPRIEEPPYDAVESWAEPPLLEDVFRDFPPSAGFTPRLAAAFRGFRFDPWRLYGCKSHRDFHDAAWTDAGRALTAWKRDAGRSEYRHWSPEQRRRFDTAFVHAFDHALARLWDLRILPAFESGFEDGWDYGAFLHEEWRFRSGYAEGFDRAATEAAIRSASRTYPPEYERAYARSFAEWEDNPRPEILDVILTDEDDDGVFEPGEGLRVAYEIANFGGRGARLPLRLDGDVLVASAGTDLDLSRRSRVRASEPLRARIDPRTAPRTRTTARLSLGGLEREVPLRVSWPLELEGSPELAAADTLAGRAVLRGHVVNRSRRAIDGAVVVSPIDGNAVAVPVPLVALAPGARRVVEIPVEGLRPIEMLAGGQRLSLQVTRGATLQDTQELRLPSLARDLERDDLVEFMLALARDPRARPEEVERARDLLLERLRVDWREAVRGRGNPYKQDLRRGTETTALGQLVASYRRERRSLSHPAVFRGLEDEVRALSRDLPGIHPWLRRSMRKLSRRLD